MVARHEGRVPARQRGRRCGSTARSWAQSGDGLCVLLGVARGRRERGSGAAGGQGRAAARVSRTRRDGSTARSSTPAARRSSCRQFTLIADTAKGNRPSFTEAAPPEEAEPLYERFCEELAALGVPVETGVFGAHMELELVNDGPVTIVLDG